MKDIFIPEKFILRFSFNSLVSVNRLLNNPAQLYKWVSANLMLGVTLRWTSFPSSGEEKCLPCRFIQCLETGISSAGMDHLFRHGLNLFYTDYSIIHPQVNWAQFMQWLSFMSAYTKVLCTDLHINKLRFHCERV